MGLTRNRGGWLKSQREGGRLHGLSMGYELVMKGSGTGESTRVGEKSKDEPGADMPSEGASGHRGTEKRMQEWVHVKGTANDETYWAAIEMETWPWAQCQSLPSLPCGAQAVKTLVSPAYTKLRRVREEVRGNEFIPLTHTYWDPIVNNAGSHPPSLTNGSSMSSLGYLGKPLLQRLPPKAWSWTMFCPAPPATGQALC